VTVFNEGNETLKVRPSQAIGFLFTENAAWFQYQIVLNQMVNRDITRKRQRTDTIHVEISTIEHAEYQCQPAYVCLLFNFFLKFNMK
jgi:hypothetical protein